MTSKNKNNNNSIHFNVCVVIGIVPPLDQKTKNELLLLSSLLSSSSSNNDADVVMIRWSSNDTKNLNRRRWIVPDTDTEDNIPTMLVSAYLGRRRRDDSDVDFDFDDTNEDDETMIAPESFLLFIQNKLNNNNTTNNKIEYTCEVWASAPAPLPMMTYNDEEEEEEDRKSSDHIEILLQYDESSSLIEEELQLQLQIQYSKFRQKGLCIVSDILQKEYIKEMKILQLVHEAIVNAEQAICTNYPTIQIGEDSFLFREIASRSKQRFDLLITNNSKLYNIIRNGVFLNTTNNGLLQLLKKLFYGANNNDSNKDNNNLDNDNDNNNNNGNDNEKTTAPSVSSTTLEDLDLELDLSIVYSKPGANHQGWHADGNHLVGASDAGWDDNDNDNNNDSNNDYNTNTNTNHQLELPYAICIFIPLIDLNVKVGYTQFWLGSHKYKNLQGFGKFSEISNSTCDIGRTTKKGNGILYDYRLLHRGMPNTNFRTNVDTDVDVDAVDANEQQPDNTTATHSNSNSNSNDEDEEDDQQEQEQEQPPYYRPVLQLLCRRKFYKEKNNYGTKSIYDTDNDMQNK